MIEKLPRRGIVRLQWIHSGAWLAAAFGLFAVGIVDSRDGGGDLAVWFGLLAVVVPGVLLLFVVRYYRRRPLLDPGLGPYATTVLFRTGASLVPAALGVAFGVATGSWWVALAGAAIAALGLAWSLPTDADYARHRRLADDPGPPVADEKFGAAGPDEVAPWDDEHGGHGHGLVDY